jgi:hypothetical protein
LAERRRAIAGVAASACAFRRNNGAEDAYEGLGTVGTEISQDGFVQSLFQPRPKARPAFDVALGPGESSGPRRNRLLKAEVSIPPRSGRSFGSAPSALDFLAIVLLAVAALPERRLTGPSSTLCWDGRAPDSGARSSPRR